MLANQLAAKYAQAVFELATEKQNVDEVQNQLESVLKAISQNEEFNSFFYNPGVPPAAKIEALVKVFSDEVDAFVLNFLSMLVDKHREIILPVILEEYRKAVNNSRGIIDVKATVARPLNELQKAQLSARVAEITGKEVNLQICLKESIMGGVIIQIGDKLIDGSVVRQLALMKSALLNLEANKIGVTNGI